MAARKPSLLAWVAVLVGHAAVISESASNMNGRYKVASGARQDVDFNDDYASRGHDFFDVYAPEIATHYGEVFWADQGDNPLPANIVQRFAGKVMAVTGYEMDQVMVEPQGQPGVNPAADVSVPINWAYNHHYMMWMTGAHSFLRKVPAERKDPMSHGGTSKFIAVERPSAQLLKMDPPVPTSQMFSEGNGGESRKSYHGYPEGFAQLMHSPQSWHITPMQIDTRNRDCGATRDSVRNCSRFVPGPEPRQARWGRGVPKDTNYSGVLECPCNGRFGGDPVFYPGGKTKIVAHTYSTQTAGQCQASQQIPDAASCFAAAATLGINASSFANRTVADPSLPPDCSVVAERNGTATVYFNSNGKASCTSGTKRAGQSAASPVGVSLALDLDGTGMFDRSPKGVYCSNNRQGVLKEFPTPSSSVADAYDALARCENYCWGEDQCWGCSVDCPSEPLRYGILGRGCQYSAIPSCGMRLNWAGQIVGDISQKNPQGGLATITATGPADVWFGIGFDAHHMADSPYTLINNDAGVIEQKIGTCGSEAEHCAGTKLASSVKVVSNTVENGVRKIVMTRPFRGITKDHYTFNPSIDHTVHLITAVGNSQEFAYHRAHGPTEISVTAVGTATCICDQGQVGQLCGPDGSGCDQFVKACNPSPQGDLITQQNPTCNSRQYLGGLECCYHKRIMLDADQEVRPELLRYHIKIRFWFQEYKEVDPATSKPSHADLERVYYQTEAQAGEYDVPPAFALPGQPLAGYPGWPENKPTPGTTCTGTCPDGPDCECIHTITAHWTLSNTRLIYAGGHCHAPSCISLELYRNDTGTPQLMCLQVPQYGQGTFPEDKFDEAGYILIPPCLWEGPNLDPAPLLPANTPVFSIKKNRNTHHGHFGEMASWQMRGVAVTPADVLV